MLNAGTIDREQKAVKGKKVSMPAKGRNEKATEQVKGFVSAKDKEKAEKIFDRIGIKTSEAIRLFIRKVVEEKAIPFDLKIPNAETIAAIKESDEIITGKRKSKGYSSSAEMMKDILD